MITLGQTQSNQQIQLPLHNLNNHTAVFGVSGSGKTSTIISIVEQALQQGVPCLLIDRKSDLANILKQQSISILPRLLTPGASHGDPVNLFANMAHKDHTAAVVSVLLDLMGVDSSRTQDAYHLYLSTIIEYYAEALPDIQLEDLLPLVVTPGIETIGMLSVDDVLSKTQRKNLAVKLNNIIANPAFDLWRQGIALDFNQLFMCTKERPACVVYSVAHLGEEEQGIAITTVCNAYLQWTLAQQGTQELRSLMVIDECHGLMPPLPHNPSTKLPLMSLLKQARAFGNGVILGTQNAKDIDYKGLSNCKTWIVGQLKTKLDRNRILEGFAGIDISPKALDEKIAGLKKREFLVQSEDKVALIKSQDTLTEQNGPLTVNDLENLARDGYVYKLSNLINFKNNLAKNAKPISFEEETPKPSLFKDTWSKLWQ